MKSFKKCKLTLLFPLLLTGCAGKGSFDPVAIDQQNPPNIPPSIPTPTPPSSEPEGQQIAPQVAQHALGWSLDITRRNQAKYKKDGTLYGKAKRTAVDGTEIEVDLEAEEGRFPITLEKMKPNTRRFKSSPGFQHISVGIDNYDYDVLDEQGRYPKFYEILDGDEGTLRLHADKMINVMPQEGEFTYEGIWAYITDIDTARRSYTALEQGGYEQTANSGGLNYSDSSESDSVKRENKGFGRTGHHATFNIHFGNKTLKGTLTREVQVPPSDNDTHEAFSIDAKIVGSRFTGTAQANPRTPKNGAPHQQNDAFFKQQKASQVHGGFYGNQAQELAGGFLTDDQTMAVAFGAKRKGELEEGNLATIFDGSRLNITQNTDFKKTELDNLFGVQHLLIDGQNIVLANGNLVQEKMIKNSEGETRVHYCCSSFEHLRMGEVTQTTPAGVAKRELFVQGEPTKLMPAEGKVKYTGSWYANLTHQNVHQTVKANGVADGSNYSTFEADFGQKTLTGQLWRDGDISTSPTFSIHATINGTHFNGTANTSGYGIYVDPGRQGANALHLNNVPTQGTFYGKNASELGGTLLYQTAHQTEAGTTVYDKVGVVYGAQQVNK